MLLRAARVGAARAGPRRRRRRRERLPDGDGSGDSPTTSVPVIGFIAHVDTSPEMSGAGVRPIVHHALRRPRHRAARRSVGGPARRRRSRARGADRRRHRHGVGHDAARRRRQGGRRGDHGGRRAPGARIPEIPHGAIRIGFTPDEEIGRGADRFDVARFGAVCAYTLDGGSRGELEFESFSADSSRVDVQGLQHASRLRARAGWSTRSAPRRTSSRRCPHDELSPETTDGYDGYVHPYHVEARVDRTTVKVLLRDFVTGELRDQAGARRAARAGRPRRASGLRGSRRR